jgi:glycosyltransferase involved in cell wall biosynthesis
MRIAIYHNHPSGGASRAIHELGTRLSDRHEVDVFTLGTSSEQIWPDETYAHNVDVTPFAQASPVRFGFYVNDLLQLRDVRRLDEAGREIAARIDAASYDVVLASACQVMHTPSVLRFLRTPNIYYCHEPPRRFLQDECRPDAGPLTAYQRLRAAWHVPAQRFVESALQRYDHQNFMAADSVITNSEFTASLILSYYGRPATVSYLGVDTNYFQPGDRSEPSYVLSVGALEHHKGFDFIVRALARLEQPVRPPLVIVANTVNPGVLSHIMQTANDLDVNVDVRSGISDSQLLEAYQGAALFAYAPFAEPFGLAVIESMASGLPVVAVAEGGVLESVEAGVTGRTTIRDEAAFAEAMGGLLANPRTANAMGIAGRTAACERWTWRAATDRLEASLMRSANRKAPAEATA